MNAKAVCCKAFDSGITVNQRLPLSIYKLQSSTNDYASGDGSLKVNYKHRHIQRQVKIAVNAQDLSALMKVPALARHYRAGVTGWVHWNESDFLVSLTAHLTFELEARPNLRKREQVPNRRVWHRYLMRAFLQILRIYGKTEAHLDAWSEKNIIC